MLPRPPVDAPLRSSMKSPRLLDWSAIALSPAAIIFSVGRRGFTTGPLKRYGVVARAAASSIP
jgi:hypothetical protein